MSDLGDLSLYIRDNVKGKKASLADFSWLTDVDAEGKVLPHQNLDSVPELEAQWKMLSEEDKYRLSPENRRPSKPTTPFWSERPVARVSRDEVVTHVRSLLHQKVEPKSVIASLSRTFDKDTLRSHRQDILSEFDHRGLLGHVYVDASLFPKCASGKGQDEVRTKNASALFVLAKEDCHSCRWASPETGSCQRFQKTLIASTEDILYSPELVSYYKGLAASQGVVVKELEQKYAHDLKGLVQKYNQAKASDKASVGFKPVQADPSSKVSSEEAKARLKAAKATRAEIGNYRVDRKVASFKSKMLRQAHSRDLVDQIKSDPMLESLKKDLYLEGSLYADMSVFATEKEAKEYLSQNPTILPYNRPGQEDSLQTFSLKNREAVSQIVHRYALQKMGPGYDQNKMAKLANRLFLESDENLRRFAQRVYSQPLPEKLAQYNNLSHVVYDPTRGLTASEAQRSLREFEALREVAVDSRKLKTQKVLLTRMAFGKVDQDMRDRIEGEDMPHLKDHLGMQGEAYLITEGFSSKEVMAMCKAKPSLKNLPHLTFDQARDYVRSEDFQETLWNRYAKVSKTSEKGRQVKASFGNRMASLSTQDLMTFASLTFTKEIPPELSVYQAHGQGFQVKAEDISSFLKKLRNQGPPEKVIKSLGDYVSQPGGKNLLAFTVHHFGAEAVKSVYFSKTKNASDIESFKKDIVARVTDPAFQPDSLKSGIILPSFYQSKMGRWLRNQVMSGVSQDELSRKLASSYSEEDLVLHAPMILAFRQEMGLMGSVYVDSASYSQCDMGKRATKATVTHVVASEKCQDCVHNRQGSCLVYGRDLKAKAQYGREEFEALVHYRIASGEISSKDAEFLLSLDSQGREWLRKASTYVPSKEVRKGTQRETAFYGDVLTQSSREKKSFELLTEAKSLISQGVTGKDLRTKLASSYSKDVMAMSRIYLDQLEESLTFDMSKHVSAETLNAPTENLYMEQFGLSTVAGATLNFDLNPEASDDSEVKIDYSYKKPE